MKNPRDELLQKMRTEIKYIAKNKATRSDADKLAIVECCKIGFCPG